MKVRGERECRNCGRQWSYYEAGAVTCPDCGSVRSVGRGSERTLHTASAAPLDLETARRRAAADDVAGAAAAAASAARETARSTGFVHGGDLVVLDARTVAVEELAHAATLLAARADRGPGPVGDAETEYFLSLLEGAPDGERPPPALVPDSLRPARGLAAAALVGDYRRGVSRWAETTDAERPPAATRLLGRLGEHAKRVDALDGEVDPESAEELLAAARELSLAIVEDDAGAFDTVEDRLDELDDLGDVDA